MAENLKLEISVDADGAVRGIKAVQDAEEDLVKSTEQVDEGFSSFQASIVTLHAGLGLAQSAISTLTSAAGALFDGISRGSDVADISDAFASLTEKAGGTADVFANELDQAMGSTIAKFDLMKQANELLLGGLKPDQILTVADAARSLGEVTGVDATEGMNRLADSLLRGNDRALKSMGIILDLEKAQDDYAKSLGISTDALTEQEKVLATRQAILDSLKAKTSELGKVSNDAGDNIKALGTAFENKFDEALTQLAGNEGLNQALSRLVEIIKTVDFKPLVDGLAGLGEIALDVAGKMVTLANEIVASISRASAALDVGIPENLKKTGDAAKLVADIFTSLGNNKGLDVIKKQIDAAKIAVSKLADEGLKRDLLTNIFQAEQEISGGLVGAITSWKKAQEDLNGTIKGTSEDVRRLSKEELKELNKQLEEQKKIAEELNSAKGLKGFASEVDNLISTYKEGIISTDDLNYELDQLYINAGLAGGETAKLAEIIDLRLGKAIDDLDTKKVKEVVQGFGDLDSKQLADSFQSAIGDALLSLASGEHFGEAEGKQLGAQLGADIANSFHLGPIGEALGAIGGQAIAGAIHDAFSGGGNADTEARKAVDQFFAELFDKKRLRVIIDGQLTDLFDLDFGGSDAFNEAGWDSLFAGLPLAAQNAFGGAGLAFNELLATGQEIGAQIASVLANNVGGELNYLQLLVKATGFSFEQMSGAVVEAFLSGKTSALEAQGALAGIQEIAQKGIPGALGAVTEAFNNLIAAGIKGGRVSVDALQDLGAEALELGKSTLPELQQLLVESGEFTAEDIAKLFEALEASGIGSLEQLRDATAEQLIPVLAELQKTGFSFADVASDKVDKLVEQLNQLEDKDVTVNVKVNASDSDRQTISQLSGEGVL